LKNSSLWISAEDAVGYGIADWIGHFPSEAKYTISSNLFTHVTTVLSGSIAQRRCCGRVSRLGLSAPAGSREGGYPSGLSRPFARTPPLYPRMWREAFIRCSQLRPHVGRIAYVAGSGALWNGGRRCFLDSGWHPQRSDSCFSVTSGHPDPRFYRGGDERDAIDAMWLRRYPGVVGLFCRRLVPT
jgi:hypothetical protein